MSAVVVVGILVTSSTAAHASHIFFTDVTANGVPLDPNPLSPITASPSGDVTFFARGFGSPDTLDFSFTQVSGTNSTILAPQSFPITPSAFPAGTAPYPAGTPIEFTWVQNFNGTFTGTLFGDIPSSFPDYISPGESTFTAGSDSHTFAFSVTPAVPTPEPASFALWSIGAIGMAIGAARRKRRAQTAKQSDGVC
jgi:hypothetical protein